MAHTTVINLPCSAGTCASRATREVFDATGASCGYFCRHCAAVKVRELQRAEDATTRPLAKLRLHQS
jgi:hypothetical protein